MIAEAVALNGALTQIVKFAAGRERPFVHALPAEQKAARPTPRRTTTCRSIRRHTSFAFSLAVSTATVASMRHYQLGTRVSRGAGLRRAAAFGYLRIAADPHYFTDVAHRGRGRIGAFGSRGPLRVSSRRGRGRALTLVPGRRAAARC